MNYYETLKQSNIFRTRFCNRNNLCDNVEIKNIDMENTCKKCGETKDISLFVKNKKCKKGVENKCKQCHKDYIKVHRLENIERYIRTNKKWIYENKEKYKEVSSKNSKKWRLKNLEYGKILQANTRDNLSDSYCKRVLKEKGIQKEQITPELIEVQRIIIKTKRLCKTSQI